jgi:hypothetical protein
MSHWKMLFSIELLKSTGKDNNCREILALPYFSPEVCWDACQWLGHNPRA